MNQFFLKLLPGEKEWVKEGYIGIFIYTPLILRELFEPFINEVIAHVGELVSSEEEKVREISLRVMKILIQNFGATKTTLLMAPINKNFFSREWR